jgi:hypothetical protein
VWQGSDALPRFSSPEHEGQETAQDKNGDPMPKNLSKKVTSLTGHGVSQPLSRSDYKHLSLDDLSVIIREMLMDKDLEVSKVRPFFWTLVEAYVDRFQVFPFDAIKALSGYLELQEYPQDEMRGLVKKLEKLHKKHHGTALREPESWRGYEPRPATGEKTVRSLDDEISELRETLKYAAIVGERLDDQK